jgi:hypothetical protein
MAARILLAVALCLVVYGTAKVGSALTGPDAAAGEITEQRYVRSLNAICVSADAAERELAKPRTPAALLTYLRKLDGMNRRYNNEFRRLVAPPSLEEKRAAILPMLTRDERLLGDLIDAAAAGDGAGARALADRLEALGGREQRAMAAMGAKRCGA